MKKIALALAAATMVATPAVANHDRGNHYGWSKKDHKRDYRRDGYYDYRRYQQPRYQAPYYPSQGYYGRVWTHNGRYYCTRSNGTTGLLVGAGLGALLGREIDGGRDRTTGTILGAIAGAVAGRSIDRSRVSCR